MMSLFVKEGFQMKKEKQEFEKYVEKPTNE